MEAVGLLTNESECISLDNMDIIGKVKSAHDAYNFLQDRLKTATQSVSYTL